MALARSYLLSILLYVSAINEIYLPTVTCQDEEGSQCLPKTTFLALLRLPEVSSNLAAYSRTARIIQDAKGRNDIVHLKALSTEDGDDDEICIPGGVYLELFRDPAMRGHLSAIGRTQKIPDLPASLSFVDDDDDEILSKDAVSEAEKRSIATLAKNDDLPISLQDRGEEDDGEKRSITSRYASLNPESVDALLRSMVDDDTRKNLPAILRNYMLPNGELDMEALSRDYPVGKRNVGSLAREYALPLGRRNVASLARFYGLPSGKRNVGSLARERLLPQPGRRNVASLAAGYMLPQNGKRNVAALARDYSLPYGKRYLASLARTGGFPVRGFDEKRSIASLARNGELSAMEKRAKPPGVLIMRTLNRQGRSIDEKPREEPINLRAFVGQAQENKERNAAKDSEDDLRAKAQFDARYGVGEPETKNRSNKRTNDDQQRRKRQIDFSDEYPLPVMQNANALDYEDMLEALAGQYPNMEKRFMGRIPQMGPRPTTPPTRRLGR